MNIEKYHYASSLDEAYEILSNTTGASILGGCGYLRMGNRKISVGIDLSKLGLDFIRETDSEVQIGAMASLRLVETDDITKKYFGGVMADCVRSIVGVQLRNLVTMGGTVAGRYPFSDVLTPLMSLDAQIHFASGKVIPFDDFMENKSEKDIVSMVSIKKDGRVSAFESVRNSATDYAIVNVSVSKLGDDYRVVIGARPAKAVRAFECEEILSSGGDIKKASEAIDDISFGDNVRGSAEYRRGVVPALIRRAFERLI